MMYTTAFVSLAAVASAAVAPFGTNGTFSAPAQPTTTASPVSIDCATQYNTCRQPTNGVSANQASCAADNAACKASCQTKYDACRTPTANRATCAAEFATCLGENPFASNGTNTVIPVASPSVDVGDALYFTTEVVTAYTTYCPAPTVLSVGGKVITVTAATTLTITDCPCTISKAIPKPTSIPGGCNPAHPGSCPSSYFNNGTAVNNATTARLSTVTKGAYTTTQVYTAITTYCPSSTQVVVGSTTIPIPASKTVTIPAMTQTHTIPASSSTVTYAASTSSAASGSASKTGSKPTSSMAVFQGAASRSTVGGVTSFFIAVASYLLI